jgi:RNA polymerase sigma factor (sigma-70 family)
MSPIDDTRMMGGRKQFPTTSWNLVRTARTLKSLDRLISVYWKPLYFFVRRRGYDNEAAKDAVQGFLTAVLEKGSFNKADPKRGRFRTFLLVSFSNYLRDSMKAESRAKRGGKRAIFSLDFKAGEAEYAVEALPGDSPETVLNRAWAKNLWKHAITELKADPAHLKAFELYLADTDYNVITQKTGLTYGAAKAAIHRVKSQLRDIIVDHIQETVTSDEELKAEVAEFMGLLS